MNSRRWLASTPHSDNRFRLYCFNYAGGTAQAFQGWQKAFPNEIEVCAFQLPGRGPRFGEPPHTSMTTLLPMLADVIRAEAPGRFSFFGHSLGALVAFELARYLQAQGSGMPQSLVLSGCEAPRDRGSSRGLSLMSDEDLIVALKDFNGAPAEVLEHRGLMSLLLPVTRIDLAMAERYMYRPGPLLDVELDILAGTADPHVDMRTLPHWSAETTARCVLKSFPGDHFFIHTQRASVLEYIRDRISPFMEP